jgi:hypothetical protein
MNPLFAFAALGCACVAAVALWRAARIGLSRRHGQPDPFFHPFGDVPTPPRTNGYTAAELAWIARLAPPCPDPERRSFAARPIRPIVPPDTDSARLALPRTTDGGRSIPPGTSAVRHFFRWGGRHE